MSNIVIIGSGPAGVSAALYAARTGVQTTVLTKGPGALDRAELIQNYYGFAEPITGAELERRGIEGAKAVGVEFVTTEAVGLTYTDKLTVETLAGDFPADAVILATGASRAAPRIPGLAGLEGHGVSYCATCDGMLYRDRPVAAVVLGAGDSFHLVPRALALCTTGLENYTVPLGLGKWITSVTMTVFYVLLYYVWRKRYEIKGKAGLTAAVYGLAAARVILCMMPQNQWLSADSPLSWGIYRNIPFAILGLLIIVLFYRSAKERCDSAFRWMWLTIVLSFGFYIPVVLWADTIPMIGMLMIPKTCAYVWTVLIGYRAMKQECK